MFDDEIGPAEHQVMFVDSPGFESVQEFGQSAAGSQEVVVDDEDFRLLDTGQFVKDVGNGSFALAPVGDFPAKFTPVTWSRDRALHTIQGFCQNAGGAGFADSTNTGEQVAMGYPTRLQHIFQHIGHMLLSDDIVKLLGPPFTG